tara:strand:- start:654 stop:980 length:327 start_codon:yes stop_codon:yes gene_type:complete
VEINKILLYFCISLFLTGCFQSTAMVGPAITLASTGNVSQAGIAYFTNQAVQKETGMSTAHYISSILEEKKTTKKNVTMDEDFITLVNANFEKTRKKLLLQNQSIILK